MTAFPPVTIVSGVPAPLLRDDVDTDAIIPSREINRVSKAGLGQALFAGWRYRVGTRDAVPDFVLNRPEYAQAAILLGGANFGCGSSREHAVWALHDWGIRVVIAPGFAPIFRGNCVRNGVLPAVLDDVASLADGAPVTVDLAAQRVRHGGRTHGFDIAAPDKAMLLGGLDAIDLTRQLGPEIAAFHARDRAARPWIYA
ncbi:3-isopropylmalate dehydratase small subunit [Glacieibacterium frigidum]|uniref:3-isopropylmalate dehydratase n=1 Tax=Glacieibacterium frigidum TaxID=2593303 RepID=A0A552UHK2_9SPHN|nr:3-isopropylmalate dehydratase small subunit [Glacieibacterium frigidum]TRW17699.1 3-isopropylmalate dehydratase small subunit [Glacieibacterium frigidum]